MKHTKSHFKSIDEYYERAFGNYESKQKENLILNNLEKNLNKGIKDSKYMVSPYYKNLYNNKKFNDWEKYFNKLDDKNFGSMGDIYKIFKQILSDIKSESENTIFATDLLDRYRIFLNENKIITNTKILDHNSEIIEIIHNSNSVNTYKKSLVNISDSSFFSGDVSISNNSELFIQALFDTDDDFSDVVSNLEKIFRISLKNIYFAINIYEFSSSILGEHNLSIDYKENDSLGFHTNNMNAEGYCISVGNRIPTNSGLERYIIY